jgi:hypothetical protein
MLESIAELRLGGEDFELIGIRVRYREKGGRLYGRNPQSNTFGLEPSQ